MRKSAEDGLVSGWNRYELGQITKRVTRRNHTRNQNALTISAKYGLVSQEEFFQRRVASSDTASYFLLERGDFAYNKSYSEGYPAGVIRRLEKYDTGIVSPLYICFRPDVTIVDPNFLAHYFNSGLLNEEILWIAKEGVRNHGLLNVKVGDFFSLPITLPPLAEQGRIAEIIDTLDSQIEVLEAKISKIETLSKSTIYRMLRETSQEAEFSTMGFICHRVTVGIVVQPARLYADKGIPVLRSKNIREYGIDLDDVVYMPPTTHAANHKTAVIPGDIVTVRTGVPGVSAVIPDDLPTANCVDIIISRPRCDIDPEYLCSWINSDLGRGQVLRAQGGLAQQHFNVSEMLRLNVAVPHISEQKKIAEVARSFDLLLKNHKSHREKMEHIKEALMEDLLTGRVRVSDAETVLENL